jgi:hypothetical protein
MIKPKDLIGKNFLKVGEYYVKQANSSLILINNSLPHPSDVQGNNSIAFLRTANSTMELDKIDYKLTENPQYVLEYILDILKNFKETEVYFKFSNKEH